MSRVSLTLFGVDNMHVVSETSVVITKDEFQLTEIDGTPIVVVEILGSI